VEDIHGFGTYQISMNATATITFSCTPYGKKKKKKNLPGLRGLQEGVPTFDVYKILKR
jgi:hypothetical protein